MRLLLTIVLPVTLWATTIGVTSGQVYHWRDASGAARTSSRLDDIPVSARGGLRCVARVVDVVSGDRFIVTGGHRVRLIGIAAPEKDTAVDASFIAKSRAALAKLIAKQTVTLRFDRRFKDEGFHALAYVDLSDGRFVNEEMLRSGMARAAIVRPNVRFEDRLRTAQRDAIRRRRGLWEQKPARPKSDVGPRGDYRRAFSLGLYSQFDDFDYRPFLREIKAIGATHVMFVTPWFLKNYRSTTIRPKRYRSCSMKSIARAVRHAHEIGLAVALMPICLLEKNGSKWWRGNVEPRNVGHWFDSYNRCILAFADVARISGVELLVVGSEFSSMEKHETHWRDVVRNVRERFPGTLSYSANWDHLGSIGFWDTLDIVGMTGYHSLTDKDDPTVAELVTGWRKVRRQLENILRPIGKPYFFTELGYASLDGTNKNPWDYVTPKTKDDREQADCYRAWFEVWWDAGREFRGAYFYNWWRNGDDEDARQYTIHGKPAEAIVRRQFAEKR